MSGAESAALPVVVAGAEVTRFTVGEAVQPRRKKVPQKNAVTGGNVLAPNPKKFAITLPTRIYEVTNLSLRPTF
jgi:hypothetical protein